MLHYLYLYVVWSYLIGIILFAIEGTRAIWSKDDKGVLLFGAILLLLAPLTTWHGVLHYVALIWSKITKTPFKPWI